MADPNRSPSTRARSRVGFWRLGSDAGYAGHGTLLVGGIGTSEAVRIGSRCRGETLPGDFPWQLCASMQGLGALSGTTSSHLPPVFYSSSNRPPLVLHSSSTRPLATEYSMENIEKLHLFDLCC